MFLLTAFGTCVAYDPALHVGARHLESGYLRQPYFPKVIFPIWKAWNNEMDCTTVREKLSHSPAAMIKAEYSLFYWDVGERLNTLHFIDM